MASRRVPWWAMLASALAPCLIIGGWAIAGTLQPPGYDPVRDTISDLASLGASHRWVMTLGLAGAGACYVVIAAGLRPAAPLGRVVLGIGGLGTFLVAAFPQPVVGNSVAHTAAATLALIAMAIWPAFGSTRRPGARLLSPGPSAIAVSIMLASVAWFALELHGGQRGLAERVATGTESLWPFVVVAATSGVGSEHRAGKGHAGG